MGKMASNTNQCINGSEFIFIGYQLRAVHIYKRVEDLGKVIQRLTLSHYAQRV